MGERRGGIVRLSPAERFGRTPLARALLAGWLSSCA